MKFNRSIPYFNAVLKADVSKRITILQAFPTFVIDDLLEILLNIVRGTMKVTNSKFKVLKRHKKPLIDLVNSKNKKLMRKVIYKQRGGFIGALIPIALSALTGLIGRNL